MVQVVLAVGVAFAAFAILALTLLQGFRVMASWGWSRASGVIERSQILERQGAYRLTVTYSYEVDGRRYESDTIRLLAGSEDYRSRKAAEEARAKYREGQRVSVAFDPDDPGSSALELAEVSKAIGYLLWALVIGYYAVTSLAQVRSLYRGTFTFPDLNFSFEVPPGWSARKGKGERDPALIVESGERTISVMGLAFTVNTLPTAASAASDRMELIQERSESHRVLSRKKQRIGELDGVLLEVECVRQGVDYVYASFCAAERGFRYEVLVHGPKKVFRKINALALLLDVAPRQRILDSEISSYSRLAPLVAPWVSPAYGYRFSPPSQDWRQWSSLAADSESSDFGAFHAIGGILTVMPVTLPSVDCGLAMEAVCAALLELYTVRLSDPKLSRKDPGDPEERRFDLQRTLDTCEYRTSFLVKRWSRIALLLAFTTRPGTSGHDAAFAEAVSALAPPDAGRRAPSAEDLEPAARARHVRVLQSLGSHLLDEGRHVEACAILEPLLELAPDREELLRLVLFTYTRRQDFKGCQIVLERHLPRFGHNHSIRSFEPYLHARLGRREEAIASYRSLFADGWRDREDAGDFVEQLLEAQEHEEALAFVAAWRSETDSDWLRRLAARIHRQRGNQDAAIELLEEYARQRSTDFPARIDLAHEYNHAGRYKDAIEVCEVLLDAGHVTSSVHFAQGVAESRLKWYPQARRSFEAALQLDPTDRSAREWLDHVVGELGQGSNRAIRRALDPVDLPPPEDAEVPLALQGESAVHLEICRAIDYERKVSFRMTSRHRIRVLGARGVERFSTYRLSFDPESEELFVHELRVRDESGDTVAVGRLEDWFVKDVDEEGNRHKVVHLPVPGLAVGRTLEVMYSRRMHGTHDVFPYKRFSLCRTEPVLAARIDVRGDLDGVLSRTVGEVEQRRDEHAWTFRARNVEAWKPEPFAVEEHLWRPTLWLAQPDGDWSGVARKYIDRIAERMEPNEKLAELAGGLTAGLDTPEEKAAALADFVRRRLVYKALSFGPRASIPDDAQRVIDSHYGDCKGHSIVFFQLMQGAGVSCRLALVSTEDPFWEEAATPWQFNHMINFCPDLYGGHFVDCVDKGLPFATPVPNGLSDRTALILDSEAPGLLPIPAYPDEGNRLDCSRSMFVRGARDVVVQELVTLEANLAAHMRNWLAGMESSQRRDGIQGLLRGIDARVTLERLEVMGLDENEAPVKLDMTYFVHDSLEVFGRQRVGRLPALWETDYLAPAPVTERRSPFRILMPYVVHSRCQFAPGEAGTLTTEAVPRLEGDDAFCKWTRRIETKEDGSLRLEFEGRTRRGAHGATEYNAFRKSQRSLLDSLRVRIVID